MNRQRKWQLKQRSQGKCMLCNEKALPSKHADAKSAYGLYCERHARVVSDYNLARYYARKAKQPA